MLSQAAALGVQPPKLPGPISERKMRRDSLHLLGRDIPVLTAADGTLRADDDGGKPASAKSVQSYVAQAFGDRLAETQAAMEALAASLPPEELNRVGFRLYERFRPDVPEGQCPVAGRCVIQRSCERTKYQ